MTIEELDAEIRPYGWHAWKSRGSAVQWAGMSADVRDGMYYATGPGLRGLGTTEWAPTADALRAKLMRLVRGLFDGGKP